jgi:hypothetical protein
MHRKMQIMKLILIYAKSKSLVNSIPISQINLKIQKFLNMDTIFIS